MVDVFECNPVNRVDAITGEENSDANALLLNLPNL